MKLYPILFEAARTAAESLSKGIIAIRTATHGVQYISLLSKRRAEKALEKTGIVVGGDSPSLSLRLRKAIANDATVASVTYSEQSPGLYAVQTSAGVNKFGPLAYQLVMFDIQPDWLKSDTSLSSDSLNVWQKMYDLSEKGVYERNWVGNFADGLYIVAAMMEIARQWHGDDFFSREGSAWDGTGDEQSFLKFLAEQEDKDNSDPALFGYFWAYRKTSHEPEIEQLFAAGDEFMSRISNPKSYRQVGLGVRDFFSRRYASNY
jgi:hypothetical protein